MTANEAADIVEKFARRYVAERENQDWRDAAAVDGVKAQGWAMLQAAAELRRHHDNGVPKINA
jgi:hypothetical protein